MQQQKNITQRSFTPACPNCGTATQGFSVSLHHYECPNCNITLQSVRANATQSFEWVIAGVGFLLIVAAIAELCS